MMKPPRRIESERDFLWTKHPFREKGEVILLGDDLAADSLSSPACARRFIHEGAGSDSRALLVSPFFAFSSTATAWLFAEQRQRIANQSVRPLKSDRLDLVSWTGQRESRIRSTEPAFPGYYQPEVFAHDEINGRRFWLIGNRGFSIIRLWEDGSVEDLGFPKKCVVFRTPAFLRHRQVLAIRRLLAAAAKRSRRLRRIQADRPFRSLATGSSRKSTPSAVK